MAPTGRADENDTERQCLDPCAKPNLTTVEPGAITFATSSVPTPPFFLTDDPSDREGSRPILRTRWQRCWDFVLGKSPGST